MSGMEYDDNGSMFIDRVPFTLGSNPEAPKDPQVVATIESRLGSAAFTKWMEDENRHLVLGRE